MRVMAGREKDLYDCCQSVLLVSVNLSSFNNNRASQLHLLIWQLMDTLTRIGQPCILHTQQQALELFAIIMDIDQLWGFLHFKPDVMDLLYHFDSPKTQYITNKFNRFSWKCCSDSQCIFSRKFFSSHFFSISLVYQNN